MIDKLSEIKAWKDRVWNFNSTTHEKLDWLIAEVEHLSAALEEIARCDACPTCRMTAQDALEGEA